MTSLLVQRSARVLRRDGPGGVVRAAAQVVRARWYLRDATSLGAVRLQGRAHVINRGRLIVGDRVRLDGSAVRLDLACFEGARLVIGEGTYINYGSNIAAVSCVEIGANCMIGQYAIIMDSDHHDAIDHSARGKTAPVIIGDNVWLGARVTVLRGAHIGAGAVVGAHSVVTGDIPPRTLAVGVPARVIRSLD
jgi:maltose O-acetyltransferase